jgi:hypothetical protein
VTVTSDTLLLIRDWCQSTVPQPCRLVDLKIQILATLDQPATDDTLIVGR